MAKNDEAKSQAAIVRYIRTVAPHVTVYHTPNGERRDPKIAAKLKWMGTLAGVLDLTLLWHPQRIAYFEVKKAGKGLSKSQQEFADLLTEAGIPWRTVRSIDDAREGLEALGIETREAA